MKNERVIFNVFHFNSLKLLDFVILNIIKINSLKP